MLDNRLCLWGQLSAANPLIKHTWNKVWNECGTKAVVQWIFINRTFLRLYDEGHSISGEWLFQSTDCSLKRGQRFDSHLFPFIMFLLFKYAWDSFKQPFSPCFAYEKPVVSLKFLHSRSLRCVWCVRNMMKISWDWLWAQCLSSGNFFDVCDTKHLLFVDSLYVYSSLYVRNESVDALKICSSLMIVKYVLFSTVVRCWLAYCTCILSEKKGTKAITGMVSFQKVHLIYP